MQPRTHAPDAHLRSPQWAAFEKKMLQKHPDCAVCGKRRGVVSHHVKPWHVWPELELVAANLITLCHDHHLWWGHLGSRGTCT